MAEVDGRCPQPADPLRDVGKVPEEVEVGRPSVVVLVAEARDEQGPCDVVDARAGDGLAVERGAAVAGSRIGLGDPGPPAAGKLDDDAGHGDGVPDARDRDGEARVPVGEVCGAVERVDAPQVVGAGVPGDASFLAQNRVLRERLADYREDGFLGGRVGLGDEVGGALEGDGAGLVERGADDLMRRRERGKKQGKWKKWGVGVGGLGERVG